MFNKLALWIIAKTIRSGQLSITLNGVKHTIKTAQPGHEVSFTLSHPYHLIALFTKPDIAVGELYMSGDIVLDDDDIEKFMDWLFAQQNQRQQFLPARLIDVLCSLPAVLGTNSKSNAKQNVAHHYDLTDPLFASFLDPWRQYSCAYFRDSGMSLAQAQKVKLARIAAKLNIAQAHTVLDIGGGWGGLSYALAEINPSCRIKAITISERQHESMNKMLSASGMEKRISCHIQDYRDEKDSYDRIVSVGMLEHVGRNHLTEYFKKVSKCLNQDGVALIHSIGRFGVPAPTSRWLKKYIFPGGYLPSLSEIIPAVEKSGLKILDIEIMRMHYADTLHAWRKNFHHNLADLPPEYDDRFIRMWDFYLVACEYYFRSGIGMVFQIQLGHDQQSVPRHRNYIHEDEERFLACLSNSPHFGK